VARDDDESPSEMVKVPLRRLLSRLMALALTTSAGSAGAVPVEEAELSRELELDGEIDPEHLDRDVAAAALGRGLALALGELRPLAATQLAATWSLSSDPLRRLALGIALEWTFPLVGDALVIDHLSRDGEVAIRCAAARAAWVRRASGGDPGVLARLADDPHPQVRAIAHAARA
jgi:hypothetical protein